MSGRFVDDVTLASQRAASDPRSSAWVTAHAGSGKTYVLAQRVVRLLLADVDPASILCLTFTKIAAAEMAGRVADELGAWTRLGEKELKDKIEGLSGETPDAATMARARRLFARALETPGGLKIQTIHAFCERLLHQFPFEANVAGTFNVLEGDAAVALLDEAEGRVLAAASSDPEGPLGRALLTVLSAASDEGYRAALKECIDRRDALRRWIPEAGDLDKPLAMLRAALGLLPGDNETTLRAAIVGEAGFDIQELRALAAILGEGGTYDRQSGDRIAAFSSEGGEGAGDRYLQIFFRDTGDPRAVSRIAGKAAVARMPGLAERLAAELGRLQDLRERLTALNCFEASAAMIRLADAAIGDYERLKVARGLLDFEDLIVRSAELLSRSEAASWVHYKLDRGIDHVLVDEAQDTSPRQWEVVTRLVEEFFSGRGAREVTRTIFAVGDEKQSIYSFQGAVPAWFARIRGALGSRATDAGERWTNVRLHLSFRSTPDVLGAVDRVFAPGPARAGLSSDEEAPSHQAARRNDPGHVELWPMIEPEVEAAPDDWLAPLDRLGEGSPELRLSRRIADLIAGWRDRGERLESGKPIEMGNILILTRSRGPLFHAINRALRARGVPSAGTDRLALAEHIVVMDLLALGDVMLLPEDDLALATVLKGPLFGFGETELFDLAHGRTGSLIGALGDAAARGDARAASTFTRLGEWRARAGYLAPHAFFAGILGPDRGRRAFLARFGAEADDVIDEFLRQALAYEGFEPPSFQGFLAFMRRLTGEVKRDSGLGRDEVRVMTVHGAKGLEADVVFLADDGGAPAPTQHRPRIVTLAEDLDSLDPAPFAWMPSKPDAPQAVCDQVDRMAVRAAAEYRRLLYVGLTRARDRLYVCGVAKKRSTDATLGWHALVTAGLSPDAVPRRGADGEVEALVWRVTPREAGELPAAEPAMAAGATSLPVWARTPAPPPPIAPARLTPSSATEDAETETSAEPAALSSPAVAAAIRRGRIVHRLLEALPEHPTPARRVVGAAYLDALAAPDAAALLDEVLAILDDPSFAPVFAPGSRAEIGIAGLLPSGGREALVSGRIDRLAVTPDGVLIVDYKTNRDPPISPDETPPAYLAQLALYREVLSGLYPDRPVSAAILWTAGPRLMPVPPRLLHRPGRPA